MIYKWKRTVITIFTACIFSFLANAVATQKKAVATLFPGKGNLVLTGGSFTKDAIKAFVEFAGGSDANFVFVPSASSGIKLESGYIWEPKDSAKEKKDSLGFGFLKNFVINPHLMTAKRETELISVLDWHPELVGFGVDDETTLIVKNGIIQTIGKVPVYVYDNQLHDNRWWYELPPGKKFSLKERKIIE